jgi:hypothetical protein
MASTATTSTPNIAALVIGNGIVATRVNTVRISTGGEDHYNGTIGVPANLRSYTAPSNISGNVTINASADKLIPNEFSFAGAGGKSPTTVAGALAITGGQGVDLVYLTALSVVDVVPAEDTVLEVGVSLGNGANTMTVTDTAIGAGKSTDADFAYTGGTGTDTIAINIGTSVTGSATYNLGNGFNTFTDSDAEYNKSVTIIGGKNRDLIDMAGAIINGLMSASLGAGQNNFNLDASSEVAGGLTYVGGSGVDTVTINTGDKLAGDVTISLGTNADSLTLTGFSLGGETVTSITIDLGVDSLTDNVTYDIDLATDGIWTNPLNLGYNDNVHN